MQHRPPKPELPDPGEVVELRVHGVGGATPEELLDVPVTVRVAGDPAAGFFRPWPEQDRVPALEGYSWGGLTSASRLRALWVLLMPFALVNVAGWMVRHGGEATRPRPRRRLESAALALVRIFGLVVTVAMVAYLTVAGLDLIAYQCGAHPTCAGGRWWLSPWNNRLVAAHLGRGLVVGSGLPIGAVLAIAWLARRSQQAIHPGWGRAGFEGSTDPAYTVGLTDEELWDSPQVAHRLGLTHTAAALASVALTLAAVAGSAGVIDGSALEAVGLAVLAMSVLVLLRLDGVPSRVHLGLLLLAAGHLMVTALAVWLGMDGEAGPGLAPGARIVPELLLPVYPALALVTAVVALVLWRRDGTGTLRVALVAPALLLTAAGIVNSFGSGMLIRLADLLGTPVVDADYPVAEPVTQPPIVYADVVGDTAVVTVMTLMVLAIVVGMVWLRAGDGPGCEVLADRYADRGGLECSEPADRAWAHRVGRAEALASLTDQVALVIGVVTGVVVTATAVAVATAGDPAGMGLGSWADHLAGPASVVLGILPVVAVYGISRLYRSRAVRRVVGIVWDVATFWPRWFHPWCPPGYGERSVHQLGDRLTVLTRSGRVVVSAHSQGSVLAVATLALAEEAVVSHTSLLTHGSPLTRLYARYFPEYFTAGLYSSLAHRVEGWVNLWRVTDYIGGPIEARGVRDVEVFDPPSTRPSMLGEARPLPNRHSDYDRTAEYEAVLRELAGRR